MIMKALSDRMKLRPSHFVFIVYVCSFIFPDRPISSCINLT